MPVKILDNTGNTSIDNGTIKLSDLQKMTVDYRQSVIVSGTVNSNPVVPKYSFYFTKIELLDLLKSKEGLADADAIEISLSIQLPGSSVSCFDNNDTPTTTDTSNSIVAIVSCAKKSDLLPFNNIGDMVLINGYKPNLKVGVDPNCCPNTKP